MVRLLRIAAFILAAVFALVVFLDPHGAKDWMLPIAVLLVAGGSIAQEI